MKNSTFSLLSAVLDNAYANQGNVLQNTWSELSPTVFLLSAKRRKKLKSWDGLSEDDFLFYQVARNVRQAFGLPPVTAEDLKDFLEKLQPYDARINKSAAKMAFNNMISSNEEVTTANKKAFFDKAHVYAQKAEEQRVADAKNSFPELLELINGDFGKKAEKHQKYKDTYRKSYNLLSSKINGALKAAYINFQNTIAQSIKPDEIAEIDDLLTQLEQVVTELNGKGSFELLQQKAEAFKDGLAMFKEFF